MAFCSNCGAQIPDGARFCGSCGSAVGGAQVEPEQQVSGMRTDNEVIDFFVNNLGLSTKGNNISRYRKVVAPLVRSLLPGEVIVFPFIGAANLQMSKRAYEMSGYAMTNIRMLISHEGTAAVAIDRALNKSRAFRGVEAYTYEQIVNVSCDKGFMLGTIEITTLTGTGTISVDRKFTDIIYQGISNAIFTFRG